MSDPIHAQLTSDLLTRHHLPVSPSWLTNFLANTRQPHPPFPALASTAHFRLLASDITASLSPPSHGTLPADVSDVAIKERKLSAEEVVVQVLDIQDVGRSKWAQVEAIERVERGEEVRGREVIRTVPGIDDDSGDRSAGSATATATAKRSQGPHTLTLQDAAGRNVTAFELVEIPRCWIGDDDGGMNIGCKLLLKRGTVVRRGMVMLTPGNVVVLGGKIESWDRKWREERKGRLIAAVQAEGQADGRSRRE